MAVRDIDPRNWEEFCDRFSRQHRGWLVTVEDRGQIVARNQPLDGIFTDLDSNGRGTLWVVVTNAKGNHLTHPFMNPQRLRCEETDRGVCRSLQIESAAATTRVRFRVAALPVEVAGV